MKNGKAFNMFLLDGEVTGRIKCTLPSWSGLAYKIPRTYLDACKEQAHLKQSGVYFLFGKNNEDEDTVYIGQAGIRKNGEGVLFRVVEHLKDEFYFTEAVMFTTSDNSWGPTEISYLENKFTNLARKIKRSHKVIEAYCKQTDEGFVVLAGSQIEETDAESIPDTIKKLRARCRQNNEIKDGVLTKNYLFKSPSYAASFILGMTTNGKTDWKTADGVSLKTR